MTVRSRNSGGGETRRGYLAPMEKRTTEEALERGSIQLGERTVHYTVRRSARARNYRIAVTPLDGVVIVYPVRLRHYRSPQSLLREHEEWVLRHIDKLALPENPAAPLADGGTLLYRGTPRTVRFEAGTRYDVLASHDTLTVRTRPGARRTHIEVLRAWLAEQAREEITAIAQDEAERIGVEYTSIAIRDQRTRWGSCSRRRGLSFNWRLILAPPEVLRSIVVHELCHLRHFNHSQRFWSLVERHDPDHKRHSAWLNTHGLHAGAGVRSEKRGARSEDSEETME